jgi:hypothetical protein
LSGAFFVHRFSTNIQMERNMQDIIDGFLKFQRDAFPQCPELFRQLATSQKKIFNLVPSLTVAVAASLGYASANAAQIPAAPIAAPASQAAQAPNSLTRRDVYNQLVTAEKDGSLTS